MTSGLSFFIGYRYWRARKANSFASFITFFAVTGIVLGVAALIIVSSVMSGLETQLKQRILGAVPQLTVTTEVPIADWPALALSLTEFNQVKGAAPSVTTQAMMQSYSELSAVQIYGVFPDAETKLSPIAARTYAGDFKDLQAGKYRIILGAELARKLDVAPGDKVRLLSGDGVVYSPLGPVPSQKKFTVAGLFEMGSMVDANLAYVHYQDARRLMRRDPKVIDSLRLYLDEPFLAPELGPKILNKLATQPEWGEVTVSDWRDSYGQLFSAVKMEKNMMSLMLSLIVAVAAFNIVSALVMMVVDKTTDVAVLKTQGLGTAGVMGIFIIQGALNAVIGLVIGLVLGVLLTLKLNAISNLLGISILGGGQSLPVVLEPSQLGIIALGTLLISFVATLYPAFTAARVQPANALRYE